ncbi:hypothetical protein KI387_002714, partial [Taxus chinensis]
KDCKEPPSSPAVWKKKLPSASVEVNSPPNDQSLSPAIITKAKSLPVETLNLDPSTINLVKETTSVVQDST